VGTQSDLPPTVSTLGMCSSSLTLYELSLAEAPSSVLSISVARLSCTPVPRHCLLCILGDPIAISVADAQVELSIRVSLPQLHGGTTILPALHPRQPHRH